MIDAAMLAKMKPGALLANMARGPLVVEADLVDALRARPSGRRGDGCHRPWNPCRRRASFGTCRSVIITPHVAGQSGWRIDNMTGCSVATCGAGRPACRW